MFSYGFFVAATCVFLAALLLIMLFFWNQKSGLGMIPVVTGAVVFFVFVFIFENIAHTVFLILADERAQKVSKSFFLYLLYGCSMAGIFEETGRYFAFKCMLPKNSNIKVAVGYGLGHGGIELFMSGILMLFISAPKVFGASQSLLWAGERMVALCGHVALSIIVFAAVKKQKKILFFSAIVLHGVADIPIGVYKFGRIDSSVSLLIFTFLVLTCCLVANAERRRLR